VSDNDTSGFFATQVSRDVPRDRYGRYLLPDESGENTGWTRATTFAATLAESYGLRIWEQRQVVWGLSRRPDLLTLASTIAGPEDKKALGAIVDSAHEAAGTPAKANLGTAIHDAIATVERTGSWLAVPDALREDVMGYFRELARWRIQFLPEYIERTCIIPQYKVAGTFDNIVLCPDGKYRILDKKTGNLDYAEIEFSVQMALYANAKALRNYETNAYEPMPEVATDYAIIAHVRPGTGRTELHRINIRWGWAWAATCAEVQDIRKTKHVLTPYVDDSVADAPVPVTGHVVHTNSPSPVYPGPDPFGTPPVSVPPRPTIDDAGTAWAADFVADANFWDQPDEDDAPPFVATPSASAVDSATAPGAPSVSNHAVSPPTSVTTAAPAPAIPSPDAALAPSPSAEPDVDPETAAEELVKACKGKAKLQAVAREIQLQAGITAGSPDEIKLSQHQIKIARAVVALAHQHGIALPTFEKPRKVDPAVETPEDKALTEALRYIRTMPTVQGLVEYQANLGDRWTPEHQEAARVRVEQINQQVAGPRPLTAMEIIQGATSVGSIEQAWRVATDNGADKSAWPEGGELDVAAKSKTTELAASGTTGTV
jgi:hypothetical protein